MGVRRQIRRTPRSVTSMKKNYVDTVRLLLAIAPAVFASGRFAMKGGTALNLFVQEMPRLSVDIDLVFVDHHVERQEALETIAVALSDVRNALSGNSYRTHLPANAEATTSSSWSAMKQPRSR
ncbi:hypothetical protein BH09PSE5_BH09PSE5_38650 [soil metagenome]